MLPLKRCDMDRDTHVCSYMTFNHIISFMFMMEQRSCIVVICYWCCWERTFRLNFFVGKSISFFNLLVQCLSSNTFFFYYCIFQFRIISDKKIFQQDAKDLRSLHLLKFASKTFSLLIQKKKICYMFQTCRRLYDAKKNYMNMCFKKLLQGLTL